MSGFDRMVRRRRALAKRCRRWAIQESRRIGGRERVLRIPSPGGTSWNDWYDRLLGFNAARVLPSVPTWFRQTSGAWPLPRSTWPLR